MDGFYMKIECFRHDGIDYQIAIETTESNKPNPTFELAKTLLQFNTWDSIRGIIIRHLICESLNISEYHPKQFEKIKFYQDRIEKYPNYLPYYDRFDLVKKFDKIFKSK